MKKIIIAVTAILTALAITGCASANTPSGKPAVSGGGVIKTSAVIPDRSFSGDAESFAYGDDYQKYFEEYMDIRMDAAEAAPDLEEFYARTLPVFLKSDGENRVYSPLNLYMALNILAETASGNTRSQILDLAGTSDMDSFNKTADILWQSNYKDIPLIQSRLANSIWLRNDIDYKQDMIRRLAEEHYTDVFAGEMGSAELNEALRNWTNEHTGDMLTDYTSSLETDPRTVMELMSTLYFKATWTDKFDQSRTDSQTFHGAKGDTSCEMMHEDTFGAYYFGDNFSAVTKGVTESGGMFLVLPDEGASMEEVLANSQLNDLLISRGWSEDASYGSSYTIIHLSLPKFDVSSDIDLTGLLRSLGITDAFNAEKADFTALSDDVDENIFISKADHAARVMIDEEGVTGASYVDMAYAGAGMPDGEVDFVLDRPFLFFITGSDGSILFAGTVNNIN